MVGGMAVGIDGEILAVGEGGGSAAVVVAIVIGFSALGVAKGGVIDFEVEAGAHAVARIRQINRIVRII
jgi:hypothetical protein